MEFYKNNHRRVASWGWRRRERETKQTPSNSGEVHVGAHLVQLFSKELSNTVYKCALNWCILFQKFSFQRFVILFHSNVARAFAQITAVTQKRTGLASSKSKAWLKETQGFLLFWGNFMIIRILSRYDTANKKKIIIISKHTFWYSFTGLMRKNSWLEFE